MTPDDAVGVIILEGMGLILAFIAFVAIAVIAYEIYLALKEG